MHPGTCPDGLACKTYLIFNDDFGDVSQLAVATVSQRADRLRDTRIGDVLQLTSNVLSF